MKYQNLLLLFLLLLLTPPALAWTPSSCPEEYADSWAKYEAEVRKAEPGSLLYLPHPFPQTQREILADLKHSYLRSWADTPWEKLPEEDRPFARGLRRESLEFEVIKVVDWGLSSCVPDMPRRFTWLVRVFDEGETEIARFSLNESGFIRLYAMRDPGDNPERHAFSATRLQAEIKRRYGLVPRDGQFLSTWGAVRCAEQDPCFVFHADDKTYLLHPYRGLYSFDGASPRYDLTAMETLRISETKPAHYITGGHDLFIEVEPVTPKE